MKQKEQEYYDDGNLVAPRAGAWVETKTVVGAACIGDVAPRAGAWVETR